MNVKAGERVWAKENGLKKTEMKTFEYGKYRNVYKANDGRLFYIVDRSFHGTYESKCF